MKIEHNASKILLEHEFSKKILEDIRIIMKALRISKKSSLVKNYEREPTKVEFYILDIGNRWAHLLSWIEQLHHIPFYLNSFSPSKKMKAAEITRYKQILYNVENYIIRLASLYDRILLFVDSLFFIGNPQNRILHENIVNNIHVKMSSIKSNLKEINKIISKYKDERNVIIHRHSHLDKKLRHIEMFELLLGDYIKEGDQNNHQDIISETKSLSRIYINEKIEELNSLNKNIVNKIEELFNACILIYNEKKKELLAASDN